MNYENGKVIPFRLRTRRERFKRFLRHGWLESILKWYQDFRGNL